MSLNFRFMECSPELEELLKVVFDLNGREIDVLMVLCDGEKTVSDICEHIDLDRSTVQRYLSSLKKTGLVKTSKDGRKHVYSVDRSELRVQLKDNLDSWYEEKKDSIQQI